MIHSTYIQPCETIPQPQIEKLAKLIAKSLMLDDEVASSLVYNEYDKVEALYSEHKNMKTVHRRLLKEIEREYRGFVCSAC